MVKAICQTGFQATCYLCVTASAASILSKTVWAVSSAVLDGREGAGRETMSTCGRPGSPGPGHRLERSLGATVHVRCSGLKVIPSPEKENQGCPLTNLIL